MMSYLSRILQCSLVIHVVHLYIRIVFEQQTHNLQRLIERGPA